MSDNKNMDPLERFFRKKAGEYDNIPYREEDWLKLEKKLDIQDIQYSYRSRIRYMTAAMVLIISMLGYFTFNNYSRINEIGQQINDAAVPEETGPVPENEQIPAKEDQEPTPEPEFSPPVRTPVASSPREPERAEPNKGFIARKVSLPPSRLGTADRQVELVAVERITDRDRPLEAAAIPLHTRQPFPRLSAGLVMSPDLSTVGTLSGFHKPGYKFGVTVEYNLTADLAITAGLMHSNVRYVASRRDYNPPGYWPGGMVPNSTIGECLLFDIPVNLKFNFLNFSGSRFFATAGISSYIMQREDYHFSYDSDDPALWEGWSDNTGSRHWLSNAGFSVGYELDIHRHWSLRAEPFLKVPIRGVGWGNVKLYSMGSFVSFNYKFR